MRPFIIFDRLTEPSTKIHWLLPKTNQILAYWNVDSLDWKHGDKPDLIMNNIASEVKPGSIILMHEKEQTVRLLPKIIELLKQKGYGFAPLPVPDPVEKS